MIFAKFQVYLLDVDNFSELYEIGLEINNKNSKKELGQYYTPMDVSRLLALMFVDLKGKYICDAFASSFFLPFITLLS